MSVQIIINGENAVQAANEMRNFVIALQLTGQSGEANVAAAKDEKPAKKAAKAAPVDEDEDEAPAPKKAAVKKPVKAAPVDDEDEEDETPAPKKTVAKAKAKPAADDEDEEEEAPKKAAPKKTEELVDDGKDQPPTEEGCRIMIRRVARGPGTEYAQAVLAEFGVAGAKAVPEKKRQKFIDRCQEVIDDADSIDLPE